MTAGTDGPGRIDALASMVGSTGLVGVIGGLAAWLTIRHQLAGEKIVIPDSAPRWAGRPVRGPTTAYGEAAFIRKVAFEATGGRAYGELDAGDPAAPTAKDAALLRSSLFTSVLAFGVAAAGMAVGGVLVVAGRALSATARVLREQCP